MKTNYWVKVGPMVSGFTLTPGGGSFCIANNSFCSLFCIKTNTLLSMR